MNKFKEENYEAMIGPCNKDTKKPSAGVACISKEEKAKIVITEHLTEAFKSAYEMGRAEKYLIDLGWERLVQVFNIYGQSGGGKEDIALTEAILEAVREERDKEPHLPTLIVGDINKAFEEKKGSTPTVKGTKDHGRIPEGMVENC